MQSFPNGILQAVEDPRGSRLPLRHTAHVPLALPQIPILIRQPFFQHLRDSLLLILSRKYLVRHSMFVCQICVCVVEEEKSLDDVRVAVGGCEME